MTLDNTGTTLVVVYLTSLLLVGWLAKQASGESSLKDYYLAGGSLGAMSLFFTLYATQYSGNSFFALPGKAYRDGIMAGAFIVGVMSIVLVYQLYAPRLLRIAQRENFISVGDFILWRYRSTPLLFAVNAVFVVVLVTFILGNLKAIGLLLSTASGGTLGFAPAIVLVCVIMAIYETLGGMRGVIWTDMIQGLLLMAGSLVVFLLLLTSTDNGIMNEPARLVQVTGEFFSQPIPTIQFISLVLLIALGAAVYPQAIQRIYAARNITVLRRSYFFMFFMPLLTTLPLFLIGFSGADWFPDLTRSETEQVVIFAIGDLLGAGSDSGSGLSLSWLLALYIGAAVAAIMSTIDSGLLTMGSILNKDFIARRHPQLPQDQLHRIGRRLTWVLMAVMAIMAIVLPNTIWSLLVLKLELVIQVFPAVVIGLRFSKLQSSSVLAGLIVGCAIAIALRLWPEMSPAPAVHSGLWALLGNLATLGLVQLIKSRHKKYEVSQ
ncbi:sodium:solute symporter family protein [Halioglobus maricola]|uniref:Sodium:solute symporter family protein n=1 Tax=Halioglobus maricola TaxID=2601894 RepID=A0A5P9NK16_9GAMM|nr:sodium:solute symporter family protein [Halioglobus maricola]QFU75584.1 sodium:solute symporter family protein [Halioglobus maricola]